MDFLKVDGQQLLQYTFRLHYKGPSNDIEAILDCLPLSSQLVHFIIVGFLFSKVNDFSLHRILLLADVIYIAHQFTCILILLFDQQFLSLYKIVHKIRDPHLSLGV